MYGLFVITIEGSIPRMLSAAGENQTIRALGEFDTMVGSVPTCGFIFLLLLYFFI